MSIKSLFNNKTTTVENAASGSKLVESKDLVLTTIQRDETFYPFIDFASASSFAKFGSAEEYYKNSIERIHGNYPYDGSENEKLIFELSSSYLDKYILEQRYPKTNGYANFSYGGWGTQASIADGYGLPSSTEYIYLRGGIHVADDMTTKPLHQTFDKSVVYDAAKKRISSLEMNIPQGLTTEFWLKKEAFDLTKTNKEVILDLWNGEISSSVNYGRFTLALSGTTSGTDTFIVTMQSGTTGFFEQSIGTATVTTSSLSNWHHYALSFVSASTGVTSRLYIDGDLNESKSLGSAGVNEIGGLVNGYIGALQTNPSSSQGAATAQPFSGKLSASLDDFRYWKTRRTSEEIYNNWYRPVGGGTNTDDANVNLGVYYKFNEGVVGTTSTDSVVLDYSGRLVNGSWTGYSAGARSTDSAFVESGLVASEEKDPIIYSTHPEVSSLKTTLMDLGKSHDRENPALLYNKVPQWIRDEDSSTGFSTKYLYQIIASYFDTLHAQITALPSLKNKVYPSSSYKALPFADRLIEEKGLVVSNLFADSNVLEAFGSRDLNKVQFEKKVTDIKNQIYTNIYNNLESIYKHKGTEGAIRNMLRCFGVDDEIVKLNIYTDEGTHYFSDAFKHTSENKKYIDFNKESHFEATLFQTSSANHSLTYISGSGTEKLEQYNALTSEISIVAPKKLGFFDSGYFPTPFQSASIFGLHQAKETSADYTWATQDLANFQVYLVRDEVESPTAKFVLKDYAGNFTLETPAYKQIYSNEQWNLAVRVKPVDYPIAGNVVTSSNRNYQLEFYGVNHAFDTIKNEFTLTQSLNYDTGSAYLSNAKRFYAGAHRTNFTGSVLEQTDIKIGRFDVWYDYISDDSVKLHNTDITSRGNRRSSRPSTIFGKDLSQIEVPSYELLTADWDFETISTSDASGEFIVVDVSSGSTDSRYGWMDNIIRREHRAKGFGFPVSTTNVISNEIIYSSKKELPEISYSSDRVTINGEEREYFIKDEDVSDNFYSLEKSMYQVISEEMMRNLSTAQEMSNLMGEAVERYRIQYKKLDQVRRLFFEDVEEDPDFDKFTDYFKWIDSSVSYMVSQMFPASVRFSKGISDVVESHLFERNKYQNKFPLTSTHTATEGRVKGVGELKYQWQFGHAPLEGGDNNNCLWQKERKERTEGFSNNASLSFDIKTKTSFQDEATLNVNIGSDAFKAVIADPNDDLSADSDPSTIDHLIYTGSYGLAFASTGSTVVYARDTTYGGLGTDDFTVAFWLNNISGSSTNDTRFEFRKSGGVFRHFITFDDDIVVRYRDDSGTNADATFNTDISADVNVWTHYVITFDVSNFATTTGPKLWKNGAEISTTWPGAPGGSATTIDDFYIYLDESMAFQDIVIWKNKLLAQADVTKLYNKGRWLNPTSVSSSTINDWYKFGYEDYWSGLGFSEHSRLSAAQFTISSSAGTGANHLDIASSQAPDYEFVKGNNPFGAAKSDTTIRNELTAALNTKFSTNFGSATYTGADGANATFTIKRTNTGLYSDTLTATEISSSFENISTYNALAYQTQAARESIREIIINDNNATSSNLANSNRTTYQGSTYARRRFTNTYRVGSSITQTVHSGINYNLQKNRDYIWSAVNRGSKLTSQGIPVNVLVVGAGTGQGIELPSSCDDIEVPNEKNKFNTTVYVGKNAVSTGTGGSFNPINDSASYNYAIKGAHNLPFDIFSGSITTGYNSAFATGFRSDAYVTNMHSDTIDFSNDVAMQSPFTNQWVGGHQSRHIDLNRYDATLRDDETGNAPPNNLHNQYTRAEGWLLKIVENDGADSDGAFGIVDPQYGVTLATNKYPDAAKKSAVLYRDGRAKRPFNVANIQTTTSSINHGNYYNNYELISVGGGKQENNLYFRKNVDTHTFVPSTIGSILPTTTNYQTLIALADKGNGNVFGVGESNIINDTLETFGTNAAARLGFQMDLYSAPNDYLEIIASGTQYLAIIADPNVTPITNAHMANLMLYSGSFGTTLASNSTAYVSSSAYSYSGLSNKPYSISFWYYSNQDNGTTQIQTLTGTTYKLRIIMEGNIKVNAVNSGGGGYTSTFTTGLYDTTEWKHIAMSLDVGSGFEPKLWVNGVPKTQSGWPDPQSGSPPTIDHLKIQLSHENRMQDIVVWGDKLLTQEDVDILYSKGNWRAPSTHPSASSKIIDWYKYGYESYWGTLGYANGDVLNSRNSPPYTISSSYGSGGNDLIIEATTDQNASFATGSNPYGAQKSINEYAAELSSSLSSSFTGFLVSQTDSANPRGFSLRNYSYGDQNITADEDGNSFTISSITEGSVARTEFGYLNTTTKATGSLTKTVITSRFSAPGSIDTMTYGFLDAYSQEYSVYNNLNYRNLSVRGIDVRVSASADGSDYYNFGGSGEAGTIRVNDHRNARDGMKALLSRHSGKFGIDPRYAAELGSDPLEQANPDPSFHKQQRNENRRPSETSTVLAPVLTTRNDNMYISTPIPRSDFQYTWVTSSLGSNYSITSGKQRMYGYAHPTGILSSSVVIDGDSGFVPAITFPTASEIFGD